MYMAGKGRENRKISAYKAYYIIVGTVIKYD